RGDGWHYVAAPRLHRVFATFSAGLHPRLHSFAAPRQTKAQHQKTRTGPPGPLPRRRLALTTYGAPQSAANDGWQKTEKK
ncbi:MAG TPA: hypothetical protein VFI31_00730, partial [Pirellulales bacterium]|nr:hypothetical protein [Pirellulales bacterium]